MPDLHDTCLARTEHNPLPVGLSVVVPAYNERAVLKVVVEEAVGKLGAIVDEYEILVIDDGSRDGTTEVVEQLALQYSGVRFLRHPSNRGYADALRTGFAAATHDLVAFTDADGQFDLSDLYTLIPVAQRVGLAVGYRADRKDPWLRKVYSRGYNFLARALCGTRARDCDCALKVFRRDVLHALWPRSQGFFVNTEMLTRARQLGYPLVEFPVTHRRRWGGVSKVSVLEIPKIGWTLVRFWWREVVRGTKPASEPTIVTARIPAEVPSPVARAA